LFLSWLGKKWQKTKGESWLATMSSTEGHTDEALTAAKMYRDIIRHPRRHMIGGWILLGLATVFWIVAVTQVMA
jgi:hypothetical protein